MYHGHFREELAGMHVDETNIPSEKTASMRRVMLLWAYPRFPDGPQAAVLFADHIPVCCMACCREYHDLTRKEVQRMEVGHGCPSDDCPAYTDTDRP